MSDENQKPARKLTLKRGESESTAPKLEERLHKVLAQAGLGSRRALEQRIADGLVKVNGETAQVGMSVRGGDRIELDGRSFVASALSEPPRVLMYNKPEGEVTTREDPEGRPTIFDALPALKGARWIAIGRLDINTTGLLLLTTDGELANAMMHPSHEVAREYVCRVRAPEGEESVSDKVADRLRRGVALEDGPAKFDEIERIGGTGASDNGSHDWFRVLLKEGRNREVRRLWESQGCQVSRLKRTRYGSVELPQPLLRGQSQELPAERVDALRKQLGLEEGTPSALTLQPVIGQRKAAKSTVHVGGRSASGYVGGHNTADEGRELRRFDHVREDRRGRGGRKPHGGLTVSGEAAAKQANKAFKPKGPRQPGQNVGRGKPQGGQAGHAHENPAAFRTWYVPDGVETGPSGHRNPDGRGNRGPGRGGNRNGPGAAGKPRNSGAPGGRRDARGGAGGPGGGQGRSPHPYGHPGNAPSFPSDHANPGSFNPYGDRPRSPRPAGNRPGGDRPGGQRPGPRPGGPRRGGPGGPGGPGGRGGRPGGRGPQGGAR